MTVSELVDDERRGSLYRVWCGREKKFDCFDEREKSRAVVAKSKKG